MKLFWYAAFAANMMLASPVLAQAQDNRQQAQVDLARKVESLDWVHGPATVPIGGQANIRIPKGVRYLGPRGTSTFLQLNGNPPAERDYTIATDDYGWFAILEFDPAGYVGDKDKVDPDALFKQLKANEEEENRQRASAGQSGLHLDRWIRPPHYDAASHNLEWGTVLHTDSGGQVVNYTSRILGREGVTRAVLVSDPTNLAADLEQYRQALSGFAYLPDKKYEDHKAGDKMAAYGLGALVAGGAAAAVVKSGLFAGIIAAILKFGVAFYKLIVVGAVALFALLRRRIASLFNRDTPDGSDQV